MLFLLTAYFTRVCGCKDTNILQHILKKKSKIFYTLFICLIIKTMPTLLNIFGQRFLFLNAVDEDKISIY